MGGNFYALDAATGQKLWGQKIGGAIGGGVITYTANGDALREMQEPFEIGRREAAVVLDRVVDELCAPLGRFHQTWG
jgi:PQQ enzyme repeat